MFQHRFQPVIGNRHLEEGGRIAPGRIAEVDLAEVERTVIVHDEFRFKDAFETDLPEHCRQRPVDFFFIGVLHREVGTVVSL